VERRCAVCSITAQAFQLCHAGGGPLSPAFLSGALRYGRGLYFSRTSSKSHSYGGASERERSGFRYRVAFLCKVALGTALDTRAATLTEPEIDAAVVARGRGGGYDSVLGLTVADGGQLNYEENVLYTEAAAIPSYLIVYRF